MKNPFHSVIFVDLDYTILHGPFESAVFPMVLGELAEKSGLDLAEARRRVVEENLKRQNQPGTSAVQAMDWDDIVRTVAESLGVQLEASVLRIVRSHAGPPYSKVLDHADTILRQLAGERRAIVAATKGLRKYQLPVLDALGLTPLFTEVLTPDSNNALKREIAFYGDWPRATRVQLSVGDHYEDDVIGPKSFGFKAIWKPNVSLEGLATADPLARSGAFAYRSDQTVRPDAIIASLSELPWVIQHLDRSEAEAP